MKLENLLNNLKVKKVINLKKDLQIDYVSDNSNNVKPNTIFISLSGTNTSGDIFLQEAINNGAKAVVIETEKLGLNVTQIVVENTRIALSIISANFFDNPQNSLKFISVVGTNGKTSTTHIMANILKTAKKAVGIIGTNGIYINEQKLDNDMTTPDPLVLFKILKQMKDAHIKYVVMEVSAHAIYFNKVYGIKNECIIFTNFSQDHLDFFKTMENYKNVKLSYFNSKYTKSLVTNVDDNLGKEILLKTNLPVITYGIKNPSDIFAVNISMNLEGCSFVVNNLDDVYQIKSNLSCLFNVYNILACIGACNMLGISKSVIKKALLQIKGIAGRFNLVKHKQNFNIIIDYAHTPESLKNLLVNVKSLTKSKIITVFGCPGNRDELKREIMGNIAGEFSDYVILTSDNPQFENSYRIMRNIEVGVIKSKCPYKLIDDRREAISLALSLATCKSTIIIAGKGIEDYQNINGEHIPYSDYTEVINQLTLAKSLKLDNKFLY